MKNSSFFHSDNWINQTKKEEYDDLDTEIKKLRRQISKLEEENPDDQRIETRLQSINGYLQKQQNLWNTFGPDRPQAQPALAAQLGKPPLLPLYFSGRGVRDEQVILIFYFYFSFLFFIFLGFARSDEKRFLDVFEGFWLSSTPRLSTNSIFILCNS
jgi:hypothetical protein